MCLRVGAVRTPQHRSICRLKRCLVCVELEEELNAPEDHVCHALGPGGASAGVSDPEIIEAAKSDERISIALRPSLHAKLYRADGRCLVSSANLTGKATGRVPNANVELSLKVPIDHPEVQRPGPVGRLRTPGAQLGDRAVGARTRPRRGRRLARPGPRTARTGTGGGHPLPDHGAPCEHAA